MAKRKRLSAADPAFLVRQEDTPPARSFASSAGAPPIAGVAGDASATAALDELTEAMREARAKGRMIVTLPLDQLVLDHLVRDRIASDDAEMEALVQSLRSRGQQTPIEVVDLGNDRYGLISGMRRCQALTQLYAATGDAQWASVQALLRRPDDAPAAYQAMIEENEIRVGLGFYERARIVVKAVEQGVFETEKAALQSLFATASRAKRSKVGSFVRVVHALDADLRFPQGLSERAGLALAQLLDRDPQTPARLRAALAKANPDGPDAERAVIETFLKVAEAKKTRQKSEPKKAISETNTPKKAMDPISVKDHENGDVTLSGPGVTPAFCEALKEWLASRS